MDIKWVVFALEAIALLVLGAAWLGLFGVRLVSGRARARDQAVLLFFLLNTLYIFLFRKGSSIHLYRVFYFSTFFALAVTDRDLQRQSIVGGGSVYPFVHNVLLGLRREGLGAALTTLIIPAEPAVKELLGIPEEHALAALIGVGYPAGSLPTKLRRKAVEEFATRDRFDGEPFKS